MKLQVKAAAAAILAASLTVSCATAQESAPAAKTTKSKSAAPKKVEKKSAPSVEEQINKLRTELESQINGLKSSLADKDAQLKQAQQSAAEAQASAAKAQEAASSQQQAVTENSSSVSALQSTVNDMKAANLNVVTTLSDETAALKKAVNNPTSLHYKGITLTPGGFMAMETVYRQKAIGADIPTPLSSIPFDGTSSASQSEFFATGRQSRISMMAEGKSGSYTYRGYVEADFLATGINSNNNQSNSYVLRQRVVWAQAVLPHGFAIQGGQMWSLAAERAKGLSYFTGDVKTPQTIDPNYLPGFVWTRQPGIAFTWTGKKLAYGLSVENAQTLQGGSNCPVSGSYSECLWGTAAAQSSSYNSVNGTYSYNMSPDVIAKVAVDPGWGHYEAFAIGRFQHYTRYPNYKTGSSVGREIDSRSMGGFGGSLRAPVFGKYGDFGLSGLYGYGVGRYGDTTLADVTFDSNGYMDAIENASGLATVELHPTPRLTIYVNFGEDFAGRVLDLSSSTAGSGYGVLSAVNTGCSTAVLPSTGTTSTAAASCSGVNKFVQETVAGAWYDFYKGPAGRIRYGIQYGNINRQVWGGSASPSATAAENQFYTSFRYYLP